MLTTSDSRMRNWNDREVSEGYTLMPVDRHDSDPEITIVADPDKPSNRDDESLADTLADNDQDDFDDDEGSQFADVQLSSEDSIAQAKRPLAELTLREKLMRAVNSIWWQGVVVLLIIADVILLALQLYGYYGHSKAAKNMASKFGPDSSLTAFATAIVVILLVEVLTRLAILGKYFWKDVLNIFDLVVMVLSFILMLAVQGHYAQSLLVVFRFIRVGTRAVRIIIKLIQGKRTLNQAVRNVVTENKMRYTQDGWDLDLAYITDRIIVSSLPAYDYQSFYRNHIDDVARFLDTKYGEGYIIVNCCAENYANYPISKFHERVKRYYIEDHNTGTLKQLMDACEHMHEWLSADPRNIALVHCKGGKGRSGSVICAYLLYSGVCASADEALDLFAHKRTDPTKPGRLQGVETASQRRYIEYFSTVVRAGRSLPTPVRLQITKFTVKLISPDNLRGLYQLSPFASITHNNGEAVNNTKLKKRESFESYTAETYGEYDGPDAVLMNDVRLMVFLEEKAPKKATGKRREIYFFYFWFHTSFMSATYPLVLSKHEVDRNRKWKRSPFGKLKSLTVEVNFAPCNIFIVACIFIKIK